MKSNVHYKQTLTASWSKSVTLTLRTGTRLQISNILQFTVRYSPTFRFRGVFHHVKCFPIVQWQFQKCPLSVWERCLSYREFSYSKIIEKRQGPTPGVSPREMPVLGGVYMTPGWLSPRSEYTPVPSHGSIFVLMVPPQIVMPARVTPAWVHPVLVPGREFHSGAKSRNGIF